MTAVDALINERYQLKLLPHRRQFHADRPRWEIERVGHMFEHIRPGDTVFDVGAEEGDFTALYRAWVGDSGRVVPFEPQPAYWPAIRQTWEANFAEPPDLWFGGFVGDSNVAYSTVEMDARGHGWPRCSVGPVVPDFGFRHLAQQADTNAQTRLDTWAAEHDCTPDIVVMDIEGAECRALSGMIDLLRAHAVRLVYVSMHEETMGAWYGCTPRDLHDLMAAFGYEGTYLGEVAETFWVYEVPA